MMMTPPVATHPEGEGGEELERRTEEVVPMRQGMYQMSSPKWKPSGFLRLRSMIAVSQQFQLPSRLSLVVCSGCIC